MKENLQLEVGKKYVTELGDIVEVIRIGGPVAVLDKKIRYCSKCEDRTAMAYLNGRLSMEEEFENNLANEYIVEEIKQTTALDAITRFQTDRGLHLKEYSALDAHANIVEELLESIGYDVDKSKRGQLKEEVVLFVKRLMHKKIAVKDVYGETTTEDKVDAYADVVVFAVGELMKLGYNPEKVLLEVGKEINSRVGTFVNGKFEKDKSEEAVANWYKADFKGCEIE